MQAVHAPYAMEWQVYPAPEPREVVWKNLAKPVYQRMVRQGLVYFAVFMTVLFYMIPIALISSFTTLDNLVRILPFLKAVVEFGPINTVLQVNKPTNPSPTTITNLSENPETGMVCVCVCLCVCVHRPTCRRLR